jgi:hypothetical protein
MASSSRGVVMHFDFWIGRTILAQSIDPTSLLLVRDVSQPHTVNASAVLQPDLGRRRSVTASRVLPMFPHRRPYLSRSSIKKTRTSTAGSEAFAEAAKRRKS